MADTEVKVPGVGKVKKLYVGIAVVGVTVVGVMWYRSRQNAQAQVAATTTDTGTVTDPAGNVCSALDPNSGYCPGTAEDLAYQQQLLDNGGLGFGTSGGFDGGPGTTTTENPTPGPGTFSNNAQWASYCESTMGSNGADAIAAALGKYITGGEVTAEQVTIIDEAIAIGEYPPVQGPGGRPPGINQTGAPGSGSGGSMVTVPNVVGRSQEDAFTILSALGLKVKGSPVEKGKVLTVVSQSPKAGSSVAKGRTITLKSTVHGTTATQVTVPNVVGKEQTKAFAEISAAGLKPHGPAPVKGKVHTVISESPKAGSRVNHGSTVTVQSKLS